MERKKDTQPKPNSWKNKNIISKRNLLLEGSIFGFHVGFGGVKQRTMDENDEIFNFATKKGRVGCVCIRIMKYNIAVAHVEE